MDKTEEDKKRQLQDYKDKVKHLRNLMQEYDLTHKRFLEEMCQDVMDYNIFDNFKNFIYGKAYKHAYNPPYKFMLRLEIFIDNHIN